MRRRVKKEVVKVEWRSMPEVEALARQIAEQHHHKHLERAEIKVIGKPKAGKKQGKLIIVDVSKPTPKQRVLHTDGDVHYLITIGLDAWGQLDQKAHHREIDRALCHFTGMDEKDRWQIVAPDVQEFTAILQRHGHYNADLEIFVETARQLELPWVA